MDNRLEQRQFIMAPAITKRLVETTGVPALPAGFTVEYASATPPLHTGECGQVQIVLTLTGAQ